MVKNIKQQQHKSNDIKVATEGKMASPGAPSSLLSCQAN